MAAGDRAAVGVQARVVRLDAQRVAPRQHLDGERLVQLEQIDVVEGEARLLEHATGGRDRADPHQLRLDACERIADEPQLRLQAELLRRAVGGEVGRGGAIGQPCGVAGGDTTGGAERRLQVGEARQRRVRPQELVAVGEPPARIREDAHRDDGLAHDAVLPRRRRALLRAHGELVRRFLRQLRKAVVQVLRGRAHRDRGVVDQPLRDEARVEVHLGAHRMVAHVLDAAGEHDVRCAHRDLACARCDGRERTCAHAVDREPGYRLRDSGEEGDVTAERQALVAGLSRRREDHVSDPLRRDPRVAPTELAHHLHGHVVGARLPVETFGAGLPERCPHTVDEEHLA